MMAERPWMKAIEMQFAALRNSAYLRDRNNSQTARNAWMMAHDSARLLPHAQAFAWSTDTAAAVLLASKTVPASATYATSMFPDGVNNCFFWFESPLPVFRRPQRDNMPPDIAFDNQHIVAVLIASDRGGIAVVPYRVFMNRPERGPIPVSSVNVPVNATLGSLVADIDAARDDESITEEQEQILAKGLELHRFIMAACAWLQQRILTIDSGHIERHRRKQLARENNTPIQPDVKIIQLRRNESAPHQQTSDGEPVDWSCRWVVGGHWRNQPYKDHHKLIYILPYVKGPEDKPLKVPTHTVYQVSR